MGNIVQIFISIGMILVGSGLAWFGWSSVQGDGVVYTGALYVGVLTAISGIPRTLFYVFKAVTDGMANKVTTELEAARDDLAEQARELARQESGQDPPPLEVVTRKRQELEIGLGVAMLDTMGRYLFAFHQGPPTDEERVILQSMIPTLQQLETEANAAVQSNATSRDDEFFEQVFFRGQTLDPAIATTQAQKHRETIEQVLQRQQGPVQSAPATGPVPQKTFEALCQDLQTGDKAIVKAAIEGFGLLGDQRALPYLEHYLGSDDLEIYKPAAKAMDLLERKGS